MDPGNQENARVCVKVGFFCVLPGSDLFDSDRLICFEHVVKNYIGV